MRPEVPTLLMTTMMMMMNERGCLDWIWFWSKRALAWILHTSRRRVAHISRVNNDCILRLHNISLLLCLRYLACFVRSNFRNSDRVCHVLRIQLVRKWAYPRPSPGILPARTMPSLNSALSSAPALPHTATMPANLHDDDGSTLKAPEYMPVGTHAGCSPQHSYNRYHSFSSRDQHCPSCCSLKLAQSFLSCAASPTPTTTLRSCSSLSVGEHILMLGIL
jgi:hypothetical protein